MPRFISRSVLALCALTALTLFSGGTASASYGDLDPTFAGIGHTHALPAGNAYGSLNSIAIQPDGKTVVAGEGGVDFFTSTAVIQRLNPDGTPDPTFGTGGTFLINAPVALSGSEIRGISLQTDGKIVCVAEKSGDTYLFRVTATGTLDTATFAAPNGYLSFTDEYPHSVFVDASGDVFTGAAGDPANVVLRRFNSAGVQYPAFASNVAASLASTTFYGNERVIVTPAASGLFMVTTGKVITTPIFMAAKFDTTGNLVTSWGTNGRTFLPFSIGATALTAVAQPSGALVMGGATQVMGDSAWVMARLNTGGTLDPTFVGGGKVEQNLTAGTDYLSDLVNLPGGGLLAMGETDDIVANDYRGTLRVMNADGAPDGRFGPDGTRNLVLTGSTDLSAAAAQPDGRIVTTGSLYTPASQRIPLTARFQQYVVPTPPVLSANVSSPKGKKVTAKKLNKFAGTAGTTVGAVTKVEVALQRVDKTLLKKSKRCLWLSSNKAKFKRVKAVKKKCSSPKWLKAGGTTKWSYKLKKKLPKANYVLQVRVTGGGVTTIFSSARKFSVK
jgi:uncharacterized delta-60 repeat protein